MKVGFCGLLTILFIGLKLTNQIDWSWWYVTMPSWFPLAFWLGLILFVKCIEGIIWLCSSEEERKRAELIADLEKFAKALKK